MPGMPQNDAGCRIEPPVSVPVDPSASRAATAAAEPPDEPPGTSTAALSWRRFHGFSTGPYAEVMLDEPIANSSRLAFPSSTAPSRSRLDVMVLSYGGTKGSRMRLPAVV